MKNIKIKPDGAMVKRFVQLKHENVEAKQKIKNALIALNERRNKLVLQNAHHYKIDGFDLAVDVLKNILA